MSNASDPCFRTFHALRIKGFAKADTIAEVADLPLSLVEEHLQGLQAREWVQFREARELWQLTAVGREEHHIALAEDVGGAHMTEHLHESYQEFLHLNERFKELCGDWQLRTGQPRSSSDSWRSTPMSRRWWPAWAPSSLASLRTGHAWHARASRW